VSRDDESPVGCRLGPSLDGVVGIPNVSREELLGASTASGGPGTGVVVVALRLGLKLLNPADIENDVERGSVTGRCCPPLPMPLLLLLAGLVARCETSTVLCDRLCPPAQLGPRFGG
jgi:hypothetical protein